MLRTHGVRVITWERVIGNGNLVIKVRPEEKVFLTDSNGQEMTITAKPHSAGQISLLFNGDKDIKILREKIKDERDERGI